MVNSPGYYGVTPVTFERFDGSGGNRLGYDMYREMAQTRAAAQASVAFQALNAGLLSQMSGSMDAIHAQLSEARQQQEEALAIQQELLSREQMQSHLEEFIYQTEKLVAECVKTTSDIPASSRYFLLVGVLDKIEQDGIGTAIIRGRDNKAAFEKVLQQTHRLTQVLLKSPEVQEAVKWAEKERKRVEAQRLREEQERQAQIQKLEHRLSTLQASLKTFTQQDLMQEHWTKFKEGPLSNPASKAAIIGGSIVGLLLFWPLLLFVVPFGLPFVMLALFFQARQRTTEFNRNTELEIAAVSQQLAALQHDAAGES